MKSVKQEVNHLLLMAKLLAAQNKDPMLCYFINMAIDQNTTSEQTLDAKKAPTRAA